ncbi:PAS domain-containing protein [Pelagibius litoralis]|uniref:PAS domain-containing protein n=1 Tax=Pelagibius litoralis TaxID=374515 RepID=A0A967KGR7_9PROT|nr:PAS domain-containing protein [Pelagibius litoralis]NIA72435.1 PAS domain-containing protein [Pelagibius litoralis]
MLTSQRPAEPRTDGTFFSPNSSKLYAYWHSLALRRGGVPLKDDFDPAEIPGLLPHIFIVEKEAGTGRFFFRLSGTAIRETMGVENTGRYLDELLDGDDLKNVAGMFEEVMAQGTCIRSIEGLTYSDRSYFRVEIVRLPLALPDGETRLVLGCLSRIENDCRPNQVAGAVKDKDLIQIDNDVLPRKSF